MSDIPERIYKNDPEFLEIMNLLQGVLLSGKIIVTDKGEHFTIYDLIPEVIVAE